MKSKLKLFTSIVILSFAIISCGEKKVETATNAPEEVKAEVDPYAVEEEVVAEKTEESGIIDGINAKQIFKQSCAVCHGTDGKLGANGSKDLTQSILTIEEKVTMISKGKGLMIAFESVLKPEEIKAVAQYTEQLKG
jgi:cytochrome c6